MNICGAAVEYDPFHNGHLHQLNEIRHILGDETIVVCAMSGNFTQRGSTSVMGKYARAETAVRCGADLVVELPLAAALSSAEGFARGATGVLRALGCEVMCFGAETAYKGLFLRAAAGLAKLDENAVYNAKGTGVGLGYAARRQLELSRFDADAAALLRQPNNILGVEYCRFMYPMEPLVIRRIGTEHNGDSPSGGYASASWLRKRLRSGSTDKSAMGSVRDYVPEISFEVLDREVRAGRAPTQFPGDVVLGILRRLLYEGKLRTGSRDGFDERIAKAIYRASTFDEAVEFARARCFHASRIRRELIRLALGVPKDAPVEPEYLRILAVGKNGRELIKRAKLPVIIKPATEKRFEPSPSLLLDAFADDIFALALPDEKLHVGGSHYRFTPYVG